MGTFLDQLRRRSERERMGWSAKAIAEEKQKRATWKRRVRDLVSEFRAAAKEESAKGQYECSVEVFANDGVDESGDVGAVMEFSPVDVFIRRMKRLGLRVSLNSYYFSGSRSWDYDDAEWRHSVRLSWGKP